MTSNIGSDVILDIAGNDARYEEMRKRVMEALRGQFRPEFLNRVDDMILFHPLNRAELRQIVALQIQRVRSLLAEQKIGLDLTAAALDQIVEIGFDPVYGARPLKRAVQHEIENPIATKLLENAFGEGDTIYLDIVNDEFVFERTPISGTGILSASTPPANPTLTSFDTTAGEDIDSQVFIPDTAIGLDLDIPDLEDLTAATVNSDAAPTITVEVAPSYETSSSPKIATLQGSNEG